MRAFSVLLLLCAILYCVRAAESSPVLFSDWLEQRTPATVNAKPASAAAYHEEAEYEWGCLKETSWGQCRCIGCTDYCYASDCDGPSCCATSYFQSVFTCCNENDYSHGLNSNLNQILTNIDIGSCEFTQYYFDDDVVVVEAELFKSGTFEAVCNVNQGGQCGHPFCDSMVLKWKGVIWTILAASKTNSVSPEASDCDAFNQKRKATGSRRRGPAREVPQKLKDALKSRGSKKAKKADTAELAYSRNGGATDTYYVSLAELLEGPVTITSRKYNLKYHSGFMDFVDGWEVADAQGPFTAAEVAGLHVVRPYTYTLKISKDGERYTQ